MTSIAESRQAEPETRATPKKKPFRPDIQGLRTLAVVSVILDHLLGWPGGGFVGVDIFFVISGFLITGLLYREHRRTGRVSFGDFYRRRIRRIFPMSTLVLVVTVGASYGVYLVSRAHNVAVDAIWAFFFSANWHLAIDGTNYWASDGIVSPLQHYWSLAVEEQFYLAWPLLIVVVFAIGIACGRSPRQRSRWLLMVMAIAVILSFAWAVWETDSNPTWAYFSTFSRAWELAVGALLAIGATSLSKIPATARPILGWIGFLGIIASLFFVSASNGFPGPWAVWPVLATALVIAAGTGGEQRYLYPLMNPITTYLGDISYSLYLWHFPVTIILASVLPVGPAYYLLAVVLILSLSVGSFHLVEDRIRKSSWLEPGRKRQARLRPILATRRTQLRTAGLSALGLFVALLVTAAFLPNRFLPPTTLEASGGSSSIVQPASESTVGGSSVSDTSLTSAISTALSATKFPDFTPSIDSLGTEAWVARAGAGGCADISTKNADKCVTGGAAATKDVVVIGDSFAIAWMPGIRQALEPLGWRVHPLTQGQCPSISVSVTQNGGAPYSECDSHRQWALSQVAALKPAMVILADARNTMDRLSSKAKGAAAADELTSGLKKTVDAITPYTSKVVVLSPPPDGIAMQKCVTRVGKPTDCITSISDKWWSFTDATSAAAKASGAKYVDTHLWFCNEKNLCPGFVGTTPVRADSDHLTVEYSQMVAPLIADAISP